jgi:uncharacterized protein YjiS (DUF1127 family)
MIWLWEGGTLLLVALVMRRVLRMGRPKTSNTGDLAKRRSNNIEPIFKQVTAEIEGHSTILAVSLNDAFEESKAGRPASAWSLVNIFASEWTRLTDLVESLQQLSLRYLPVVDLPVPVRELDEECFRSGTMIEFVRFNGFVDQFVFRPKLRFQLHLRLQRRAIAMLSEEFARTRTETEGSAKLLPHALTQFDLLFHDLDRLAKESLLAFRAELACLPGHALKDIGPEVEELVGEGVLKPLVPVSQ